MQPVVAIVIARGGSKRVPRKNVRSFCGHPLVAWSIVQAINSRAVDRVVLSTDDDEIEEIGWRYGAEVIRRPDWPDADLVAANRPILHAIDVLEEDIGLDWTMVTLLPTSPMRKPDDIDRGVKHWHNTGGQVCAFHRNRETFIYRDKGGVVAEAILTDKYRKHFSLASGIVTVNSPRWYKWFTPQLPSDYDKDLDSMILEARDAPNNQLYYIEVEAWQVPETDTLEEFDLCELIMEHYILDGRGIEVYTDYGSAS